MFIATDTCRNGNEGETPSPRDRRAIVVVVVRCLLSRSPLTTPQPIRLFHRPLRLLGQYAILSPPSHCRLTRRNVQLSHMGEAGVRVGGHRLRRVHRLPTIITSRHLAVSTTYTLFTANDLSLYLTLIFYPLCPTPYPDANHEPKDEEEQRVPKAGTRRRRRHVAIIRFN